MRKLGHIVKWLTIFTTSILAETHLSDDIGGKIFESSGNPHIVDHEIVVSKNTKVVIKAGCVLLFKSFTGINVFGSMIIEGTEENPVVFSSINDANYNPKAGQLPNAFDWNGIYVAESAADIKFRNFKLMYSVFGIKSKKDDITLQNGYFKQNGQFHFTINDNILYVQDNISYSYNVSEKEKPQKKEHKEKKHEIEKKPERKEGVDKRRKVAAITLMGVSVATGISTLITGIKTLQYSNIAEDPEQWEKGRDYDYYFNKFKGTQVVTIITGITCGVTFPISLFLLIKKDKSTMTKKVTLNIIGGKDIVGLSISNCF